MTDEVVADPVAVDPPPAPEPVADPIPAPVEPAKTPWYMDRIAKEAARARENEERASAAEKRAQDAEALAARLRAQTGGEGVPATAAATPAAETAAQRQAAIRQEAQTQRFYEDTLEVRRRGEAEFGPKFGEALNILGALGATTDDFIADVLAIDKSNAHALLDKLAKDPERAASLTSMTSRQRIAELTRMSITKTDDAGTSASAVVAPAPKTTSKAPPPAPVVTPSASKVIDWRTDEASDDEFDAGFKEMMAKRSARR